MLSSTLYAAGKTSATPAGGRPASHHAPTRSKLSMPTPATVLVWCTEAGGGGERRWCMDGKIIYIFYIPPDIVDSPMSTTSAGSDQRTKARIAPGMPALIAATATTIWVELGLGEEERSRT